MGKKRSKHKSPGQSGTEGEGLLEKDASSEIQPPQREAAGTEANADGAPEESPAATAEEGSASDLSSGNGGPLSEEGLLSEEEEIAADDGEEMEVLTFNLDQEEYAVDIMMIQEITKLTDITPIPRTPGFIKGVVNLRGNIVPVFDLHKRLGLGPFLESHKNRFIICQTPSGAAAVMVDEVTDVIQLKKNRLEPPPSGGAAQSAGFIKNIGKFKERLLILLDVEKVLRMDQ